MKAPGQGSRIEYEEWLARVKEKGIPFKIGLPPRNGNMFCKFEVSTEALTTYEQTHFSLVGHFTYSDNFEAVCSAHPSLSGIPQYKLDAQVVTTLQMMCCDLLKLFVRKGWDTRLLPKFPDVVVQKGFIDSGTWPLQKVVN